MVFVASGPLRAETRAFLSEVPNLCVELPFDAEAIDMLAVRRASCAVRRDTPSIAIDAVPFG